MMRDRSSAAPTGPVSACGPLEPLTGDRDASVAVCSLDAYRDAEWVPVHGFPRLLRDHGWVYLRTHGRLVARVRAHGVQWWTDRPGRTPGAPGFGAGRVIRTDPATFEELDVDLGSLAGRQRSGIRYLRTRRNGTVVHLDAHAALPGGVWET